jgi:pimeloyl-ACP methyl ester carboxylesterase
MLAIHFDSAVAVAAAPLLGGGTADDAVRVLDSYGISSAHVVGMSMGGMIAQLVALKHPARVASLALASGPTHEMAVIDALIAAFMGESGI